VVWTRKLDELGPQPASYGGFTSLKPPTAHLLVFATSETNERSYVLKQVDGSIAGTHRGGIRAISEKDDGALEWMFVSTAPDEAADAYDAFDAFDVKRWTVTMPCKAPELQVATRGDTVVLAQFKERPTNEGSGGCVVAVDRATGVTKWKSELPKGHSGGEISPYRAELRLRGDEIVMIGRNGFSDSLDILSLSTGASLYSHDAGPLPTVQLAGLETLE
jgi:hypothetical protein